MVHLNSLNPPESQWFASGKEMQLTWSLVLLVILWNTRCRGLTTRPVDNSIVLSLVPPNVWLWCKIIWSLVTLIRNSGNIEVWCSTHAVQMVFMIIITRLKSLKTNHMTCGGGGGGTGVPWYLIFDFLGDVISDI